MRVFREQTARALRVLDAILRTFEALGIKPEKAREEWRKVMEFEMRGYRFGLRIVERTKHHDHELTPRERSSIERTGRHWGPRYDYKPTGELRLALTYSGFNAPWAEVKETRKIPVEERIPQLVLAALRAAGDWLRRQDEAKQANRTKKLPISRGHAIRVDGIVAARMVRPDDVVLAGRRGPRRALHAPTRHRPVAKDKRRMVGTDPEFDNIVLHRDAHKGRDTVVDPSSAVLDSDDTPARGELDGGRVFAAPRV